MAQDYEGNFRYTGTQEIQRPKGGIIPHGRFGENALWVTMKAVELKHQTTLARGGGVTAGKVGPTFKFLAPENIQETIKNDWAPYENSIVNSIANKAVSTTKAARDMKTIATNTSKLLGDKSGQKKLSSGAREAFNAISTGVATRVPTEKADTPLTFTNSSRREWTFLFNLVAEKNPADDVVEPIKDLMKYSSPEIADWNIGIELPWVFQLKTYPANLIICELAALTSVQPTWQQPYIGGLPTKCELSLSFTDMSPLYRTTIKKGGIIRILNEKGEITEVG